MSYQFTKSSLTLMAIVLLFGCGGGGGGDGGGENSGSGTQAPVTTQPSTQTDVQTPVTPEPQPEEEPVQTTDLVAAPDFEFETEFKLMVDVDVGSSISSRAFINLCPPKSENEEAADYQNCMLQAPLTQGQLSTELQISSSQQSLFAEIWPIVEGAEPMRYQWHYQQGVNEQVFQIR